MAEGLNKGVAMQIMAVCLQTFLPVLVYCGAAGDIVEELFIYII